MTGKPITSSESTVWIRLVDNADMLMQKQLSNRFRYMMMASLLVALIILVAAALSTYQHMLALTEMRRWVVRTDEVLSSIGALENAITTAETGQRGYVLTGQESYLLPFTQQIDVIPQLIKATKQLTNDDQVQQRRLTEVEPVIQSKLDELKESVSLRKRYGFNAALQAVLSNQGRDYTQRIHKELYEMNVEEKQLLAQRRAIADKQTRDALAKLEELACLGVFFFVGAMALVNRFIGGTLKSQQKLLLQYVCTKILSESDGSKDAMGKLLAAICENLGVTQGALWMVDKQACVLRCTDFWCQPLLPVPNFEKVTRSLECRTGEGLPGRAWQSREPAWIASVAHDQNFPRAQQADQDGLRTGFAFPVVVGQEVIAVLEFFDRRTNKLTRDLVDSLMSIGTQTGHFIEHVRAEELLRQSESRFRQMADNIQEIFWITDSRGASPVFVSPAYEHIFGRTVESLFENPHQFFTATHLDDRDKLADLIRHQRSVNYSNQIEYRICRPDGEVRWLWARLSSIVDEQGKVTGLCGVTNDITDRKETEKRVSEFYSMVSHELRTPLTSIRGSLGLIEGGKAGVISEKAQRLIKIGRVESDRLIRLINDILDIKKIETGLFHLNKTTINPSELLARTLEGISGMATEAKVILKSSVVSKLSLQGDCDRLTQVLANLISNAIKYSPVDGTVTVTVTDAQAGTIRFAVSDNGPGINQEDLPKLFGMFQQIDQSDSRPKGGSGLGLAISKAIVEQHGGTIAVDTKIDEGSTFWFELPAKTTANVASEKDVLTDCQNQVLPVEDDDSIVAPGRIPGRRCVLLVEDDEATREVIKHQLAGLQVHTIEAAGGNQAIELTRKESPDLIILDLGLPKTSGFDVVTALRLEKASTTPLLVYTARDLDNTEKSALTLGITAHLTKSRTSEKDFLSKVSDLLNGIVRVDKDTNTGAEESTNTIAERGGNS